MRRSRGSGAAVLLPCSLYAPVLLIAFPSLIRALSAAWDATEDEHNPLLDAAGDAPAAPEGCTLEYRIHVHLQCEPRTALDAPLTEVVLWYLKPHATQAKVEELLTTLMGIVNKIPREEGMHRAGWGSVLGDPRQYVVMIGWDSMEVRVMWRGVDRC